MTIKQLYDKAVAEGYENAEIGIDVALREPKLYCKRDLYNELLAESQLNFGGYYEGLKRIKNCVWIYVEAQE